MLGVPAISLPVLQDGGLPLGLQLLGFADRRRAAVFSRRRRARSVAGRLYPRRGDRPCPRRAPFAATVILSIGGLLVLPSSPRLPEFAF